jgi:hypothetical protein
VGMPSRANFVWEKIFQISKKYFRIFQKLLEISKFEISFPTSTRWGFRSGPTSHVILGAAGGPETSMLHYKVVRRPMGLGKLEITSYPGVIFKWAQII